MLPPPEFKEWVSVIKDLLLGLGALATMALGFYGLTVWKRDLVGKEVYARVTDLVRYSHLLSRAATRLRMSTNDYEKRSLTEDERVNLTRGEQWRLLEPKALSCFVIATQGEKSLKQRSSTPQQSTGSRSSIPKLKGHTELLVHRTSAPDRTVHVAGQHRGHSQP